MNPNCCAVVDCVALSISCRAAVVAGGLADGLVDESVVDDVAVAVDAVVVASQAED